MNINFDAHPGFSAYVLLLMFSGAAMVLVGSPVVRRQRPLSRVLNVAFGVGFFAYGFYLAFVFNGGHYIIFFKAFILPVVLIVRAIASSRRRPSTPATEHWQTQQPYPATTPAWQPPAQQPYSPAPYAQWSPPAGQPAQPGPQQPGLQQPGAVQPTQAQSPSAPSWPAETHPIADAPPGAGSNLS